MEEQTSLVGTLFEKAEHYTKTTAELQKLKAIDKIADVLSTLAANLVVIIFFSMFFLVLNIGIALWLGVLFSNMYQGFFLVAGFYALIGIVIFIFRHQWIKDPLRDVIITEALD